MHTFFTIACSDFRIVEGVCTYKIWHIELSMKQEGRDHLNIPIRYEHLQIDVFFYFNFGQKFLQLPICKSTGVE